jgi:hypothetical protein
MPQIGAGRPHDPLDDDDFPRTVRVRDILVIPSPGHRADPQVWLDYRAVDAAVDLGGGVILERLSDDDVAEEVIHASFPRGLHHEAIRQFGQLYSFWREVPEDEWADQSFFNWDPAHHLSQAVAISRFVLDNAHGFEFAGRVIDRSDGRRRIAPLTGHDGRTAYRSRKDRFWFTHQEADELGVLLDHYRGVKDDLPERVGRALWQAERSCYSRYINEVATSIVTGFEALVNTGRAEPATAQFTSRAKALADELGFETSKSYWNWVYDVRSRIVHGAEGQLVAPAGWDETDAEPPQDVAKIAKAQDVLRGAIRRAIEDADFRAAFASDESVRLRWPLPRKRRLSRRILSHF